MLYASSACNPSKDRDDAYCEWLPSEFAIAENGEVQIQSYINNLHPIQHCELYHSIATIFEACVPMFDRVLSCLLNLEGPLPTCTNQRIPNSLDLETYGPPFTLCGRTVQVIVKIAETQLTPANPTFSGGQWYVEGSDAEQIVATGIYYFGCDNITESRLAFRVHIRSSEREIKTRRLNDLQEVRGDHGRSLSRVSQHSSASNRSL